MGANSEKFDACRLVRRKAIRGDEILLRQADFLAHSAVAVHAKHANSHASVGQAFLTGMAASASDVRVHYDQFAAGEAALVRRLDDLGREFVADHAGVLQKRLAPFKDVVVGAADADA